LLLRRFVAARRELILFPFARQVFFLFFSNFFEKLSKDLALNEPGCAFARRLVQPLSLGAIEAFTLTPPACQQLF